MSRLASFLSACVSRAGDIYENKLSRFLLQVAIVLVFMVPVIAVIFFSYSTTNEHLTEQALERRQAIAYLAATTLQENFEKVLVVGLSRASSPILQELVEQGKWKEAITVFESVPTEFPFVERVFLADLSGTLLADVPEAPNTHNQNYAYRDWYQGVSQEWQPYLSEVYKRAALPQYNIVAVSIPIRSGEKVVGIVVLQIKLDTLLAWSKEVSVGVEGNVYYLDQYGKIAAHPQFDPQKEIVDFSDKPFVSSALSGQAGQEIFFDARDGQEHLVVYEPVKKFGWTTVVEQPTAEVFAFRNETLRTNAIVYVVILVIDSLFALMVVYFVKLLNQRRLHEKLETELGKYKLALDNTSDHIVITDTNGVILYANKAAEKLTGYSQEEMLGQRPSLWGKKMSPDFYKKMWTTIKDEKKSFRAVLTNRRKSGQEYDASVSISPVLGKYGELLFFVGIERDITREKALDRARSEFVSIASHELRTPLTAIDGMISMILDGEYGEINDNLRQPLTDINDSSERLIRLVNDLLNVSRIQAGKMTYVLANFSLKQKLEKLHSLLNAVAQKKNISLTLADIPDVEIQADEEKFEQVLTNLIGNAIKFTDKGGVTISVKQKENRIEIWVTDTGIGIAPEDQKMLFGKFEQLVADGDRPAGTGLGLFISREMTQKMGGDVWLEESTPGKGSTFIFCMPLAGSTCAHNAKEKLVHGVREQAVQTADRQDIS